MEKKNMVLLTVIAVATLLVAVVGATFAYFSITTQNAYDGSGSAGTTSVTSATVSSDSVIIATVDGSANGFTATDVYPGHMEALQASVTATNSNNVSSNLKITYDVTTNEYADGDIKVTLYSSSISTQITSGYFGCTQVSSEGKLYETCANSIPATWTQVGSSQTLSGGAETITLASSQAVTATAAGTTTYFYVVIEFVDNGDQTNTSTGKTLEGTVEFALV